MGILCMNVKRGYRAKNYTELVDDGKVANEILLKGSWKVGAEEEMFPSFIFGIT